jgi:uncharacterized repeat protein (TIGR01451 family)
MITLRNSIPARLLSVGLSAALLLSGVQRSPAPTYSASDDLPGPSPHLETIPAGSLVIAMDNVNQSLVAPFNLKAYGLVNDLLQSGIPVKWAIKAGKAKDATDFTATAQRIFPTPLAAATYNFAGGPFIVHRAYAQVARTRARIFGNNVAVYELTADVTVDVRYDLAFRPYIAVNTVNSSIHTDLYDFAGITNYQVINIDTFGALLNTSCFTIFTEPHTSVTNGIPHVKTFVQNGGNFLAECLAIETYENGGRFQTTAGITTANVGNTLAYPNADLAYMQFVGALEPAPGGSHQDWQLSVGSVFTNSGHIHADNIGASPAKYAATAAKLYGGAGGMVFYLGGHSYGAGGTALGDINGQRMILNTIFVPNTRNVSCNFGFEGAIKNITGSVFEDVNGDASLADAVARTNVTARIYADNNNNGVVDTGDLWIDEVVTDATGLYTFQVSLLATGSKYLIVVDSKKVVPSAGFNSGFAQGDVWAEQTYGDDPATAGFDLGARFGGRTPGTSDNFTTNTAPASNNYQHVARVDPSGGDLSGVDFAFSFNVMTHLRGQNNADDDTTANRTIQGSFRQFLQNANAISGANDMRFTPAVAANASGGGGTWWRFTVTNALPALTDALTTVDGRAYSSANGTSVRDDNPGTLGAGGTVGVDAATLNAVNRPEFEIVDGNNLALGLDLQANNLTVRRLAIYGFGTTANSDSHANIRVGNNFTGALIEENIIGTTASSFTDPGATRSGGDNLRSVGADNGTIRNNLIGFSGGKGVALENTSTGWTITGNEIRGNAIANAALGGLDLGNGSGATVGRNLIAANQGAGLDMLNGAGSHTIATNTITGNGVGATSPVTAGVRVYGGSSVIARNVIATNTGAGVMVTSTANGNTISQNSIFANGPVSGQLGIDLLAASDNANTGSSPFYTLNDSGDPDTGGNGLLNFPVLTNAVLAGGNLILSGFARPGSTIELFLAALDPSGFGEGQTYLATLVEGSAEDLDSGSGSYSGAINGLNQGTDNTAKFRFVIPTPPGVTNGAALTATATLAGDTSEFSGRVFVVAQADLAVFKSGATNALAGTNFTYTITLTNNGPATATNAVVTDTLPAGVTFVSASGGGLHTNGVITWPALASFTNAASTNYTVVVTLPASGTLTNVAAATSGTTDPDPANNNGSAAASRVITTITPVANLAMFKTGPTNVVAATNLTYTLTLTNLGPSTASNVVASDTLPAGVTFVSASAGGTHSNGIVTWPALAAFTNAATTNFTVTVTAPANAAVLTNAAAATSDTLDSDPANNNGSAAASRVVTTVTSLADVAVFKTGLTNAFAGTNLVYTILVTNLGPSTASNVVVSDTLPAGAVFLSASGGGIHSNGVVTWPALAALTNTAASNYTVTVQMPPSGPATNRAAATHSTPDPNPANNDGSSASSRVVTTIIPAADVAVLKTGPDSVIAGSNLTYTITVTNLGPSAASNVVASDTLPAGTVFVSASGGGVFGSGTVTWPALSLTNGAATNFTVTVTAPAYSTNLTNLASGTASTPDPAPANNDGSAPASQVITTVIVPGAGASLSGFVYEDANRNLQKDAAEHGTGLTLFAKLVPTNTPAGPAIQAVAVNPVSGAYTFTGLSVDVYAIVIDDNSSLADVTPAMPAGWTGTEYPGLARTVVAVPGVDIPNQNFGLIHALGISGRVFRDNGAGGGTAHDGVANGAETGLAGVTVKLTDATGATVYDTVTTDGGGFYSLLVPASVPNGATLKVVEINPAATLSVSGAAGTTGGSYDRATDTVTFNYASGTAYSGVNFGDVPVNTFVNDGQAAGLPGTFVVFPHTFTAGSAGQVTFSVASAPSPALTGWTPVLYRDLNCNGVLEPGEPVLSGAVTVSADDRVCILVKEFIPVAAPFNAQDQLTVTAAFTYTGASPALNATLTRTDLATVGNPTTAGLTLLKTVDKPSALPGETITYTITYQNQSSDVLSNVVIYDETPAFTVFSAAAAGALPANLTAVTITSPGVGSAGAVRWTFTGTLAPGASGTVSYSVTLTQ